METKQCAAIYVRVSTEEQASEGMSIAAQIETLTQYCNALQIGVYKIYQDLGISGKDTIHRPGINELVQDSQKGFFQMVIVWKISRLSRNLNDLLQMVTLFEQYGVSFLSYSERFDTQTPVGKMTLQLLGSIAEFERNTIAENVRLGLGEVKRQGRKTGGQVLGYDSVNKHLVPNPEEAELIHLIFHLYTEEGYGLYQIAHYLTANGYHSKRGNPFTHDAIGVILDNPVYIGVNRFQVGSKSEFQIEAEHEPIIGRELFERTRIRRAKRKTLGQRKQEGCPFLLLQKVHCPFCGSMMESTYSETTRYNQHGEPKQYRYAYYCCPKRKEQKKCTMGLISKTALERRVFEMLSPLLQNRELDSLLCMKQKQGQVRDSFPSQQEYQSVLASIKQLHHSIDKYLLLLEEHDLKDALPFLTRIETLQAQLEPLQSRKKVLEQYRSSDFSSSGSTVSMPEDGSSFFDSLQPFEQKELLHALVQSIQLNQDKSIHSISLTFGVFPLSEPDSCYREDPHVGNRP